MVWCIAVLSIHVVRSIGEPWSRSDCAGKYSHTEIILGAIGIRGFFCCWCICAFTAMVKFVRHRRGLKRMAATAKRRRVKEGSHHTSFKLS
jgi:hypothetical protein